MNSSNDYVEASFTVDLGNEVQSRGLGEADLVNQLYYGIYQDGKVIPVITNVDDAAGDFITVSVGEAEVKNRQATVKMRLVKGQTYDFVFWAQVKDNKHYNINMNDLQNITVNYNGDANDETRDAFFGKVTETIESHFTKTVILKRPFAQVNVATTFADDKAAEILLGNKIKKSSLVVKSLPTTLNLLDGKVAGTANDAEFKMSLLPMDIPALGNAYQMLQVDVNGDKQYATDGSEDFVHLSMNYLLADVKSGDNTFLHEINVGFEDESGKFINTINVANLPAYRNYRTNIIGNILTTTGEFTIIVDERFEKEEIIRELWDGETTKAVTPVVEDGKNVYQINDAEELAWVAEQVNEEGKTFANEIIRLMNDIYLNNQPWTPIGFEAGSGATPFAGTFEGNNKTIYGLNIVAETVSRALTEYKEHAAGLFGYVSGGKIKNFTIDGATIKHKGQSGIGVVAGQIFSNSSLVESVTVKNAVVEGNRRIGGIVGFAYGSIINCVVENATFTATPDDVDGNEKFDNGDKVGGIVGYLGEGTYQLTENVVSNITIIGYRDLGGIVGCTQIGDNVKNNTVKGAIKVVANRDVVYESTEDINTGIIAGCIKKGQLDSSNDVSEATYIEENTESEENPLADLLSKENSTVNIPAGEYVLPKTIANGVTIIGEEGTVFNVAGASINADNVTIKNVVIQNNGEATTALSLSGKNPIIENCVFKGAAGNGNGLVVSSNDPANVITVRNCDFSQDDFFKPVFDGWNGLGGATLLIEGCTLANGLYVMHIDGNNESGKIIVKDSYCAGFITNGASLENLTFENCTFGEEAGYACANLYTSHSFINCTFPTKADANNVSNYGLYVSSKAVGDDMVIENCKMSDGTPITIDNVAVTNGGFLHWDSDAEACYWTINGERIANNEAQLKKYINEANNSSYTTIHLMEGTYTGAFDIDSKSVIIKSSDAGKVTIDGLVHALNFAHVTLRNLTLTNTTPAASASARHTADYYCLGAYVCDFVIEDCIFNVSNQGNAKGKGAINIYSNRSDYETTKINGVQYDLVIKNTVFNCNGERPIRGKTNSYIDGCTFNDQHRYAIQVQGNSQLADPETVTFINNKIVNPCNTSNEAFAAAVSISKSQLIENAAFNISGNTIESTKFEALKTLVYDNHDNVKITTCTLNNKQILESQCVKVDDETNEVKF